MKLEAGKKYVTRSGKVVECIAIWTKEVEDYQATVLNEQCEAESYTLDGVCFFDSPSEYDVVSEYVEPREPKRVWLNIGNGICLNGPPAIPSPEWKEFVEVVK